MPRRPTFTCRTPSARRNGPVRRPRRIRISGGCSTGKTSTPYTSPRPITGTPPSTVLACQAGKDVYVEKPLAHNVREGRAMVNGRAALQPHRAGRHAAPVVAAFSRSRADRAERRAGKSELGARLELHQHVSERHRARAGFRTARGARLGFLPRAQRPLCRSIASAFW